MDHVLHVFPASSFRASFLLSFRRHRSICCFSSARRSLSCASVSGSETHFSRRSLLKTCWPARSQAGNSARAVCVRVSEAETLLRAVHSFCVQLVLADTLRRNHEARRGVLDRRVRSALAVHQSSVAHTRRVEAALVALRHL